MVDLSAQALIDKPIGLPSVPSANLRMGAIAPLLGSTSQDDARSLIEQASRPSTYAYENSNNLEFIRERERLNLFQPLHLQRSLQFLEQEGISSRRSFADIGCGTAYLDSALAEKYPNLAIYALDRDAAHIQQNLREQRDRNHNIFMEGDLFNPPEALPRDLDMVNSTLVMAHMQNPISALHSMSSLLKPGGRLTAEEVDISTVGYESTTDRDFPAMKMLRELWEKMLIHVGGDALIGPKLKQYFEAAGLQNVKSDFYLVTEPQNVIKEMILRVVTKPSIRALFETIVWKEESLSAEAAHQKIDDFIDDLEIGFQDPNIHINFYRMYQVSGIKA